MEKIKPREVIYKARRLFAAGLFGAISLTAACSDTQSTTPNTVVTTTSTARLQGPTTPDSQVRPTETKNEAKFAEAARVFQQLNNNDRAFALNEIGNICQGAFVQPRPGQTLPILPDGYHIDTQINGKPHKVINPMMAEFPLRTPDGNVTGLYGHFVICYQNPENNAFIREIVDQHDTKLVSDAGERLYDVMRVPLPVSIEGSGQVFTRDQGHERVMYAQPS